MGDSSTSQCGDKTVGSTSRSTVGVGPLWRTGLSGAGEGMMATGAKT
jgi:hypothetical protein